MKKRLVTLLTSIMVITGLSTVWAQNPTAQVQVIHNAADPAAAVVDIYVQFHGTEVKLEDVTFRSATEYLALPAGTPINIIVSPGNSQNSHQVIKAFHGITLEADLAYQVIATGVLSHAFAPNPDHRDISFDLLIAANARPTGTEDQNVDIRVVHGSTDAPSVGVNANGATLIPGFSYRDITDYLSVPADFYTLEVTPAHQPDNALFTYTADLSGLGGASATILASGFLDPSANQHGPAFALIAVLADGTVIELPIDATAQVQVIHNSADPSAEVVDIYVKSPTDTAKIEDLTFRTATSFLDLPAGVPLEIVVAGGDSESIEDGLATFDVNLQAGQSYYVVATGVLNPDDFAENPTGQSTEFTLLIREGAKTTTSDGFNVDIQILHGSSDAPAVGINVDERVVIPALGYKHFVRDFILFAARPYTIQITPGNQPNETLFNFEADLSGLDGTAGILIASGFVDPSANQDGAGFTLIFVLPDGTVVELPQIQEEAPTARVQVIHNAADPAAEIVDIYVDTGSDTIKLEDVAFRSATAFLDLPAETELTIVVAGGESEGIEDGIASFPATLEDGESYYVVANGVLSPDDFATNPDEVETGFTLFVEPGAREVAEDGELVDLNVLHGATDAPNVGVNANGNVIIEGFSYSDFSGYLSVPADAYQLDVTLGGQPMEIVASFDADISGLGGGTALVIASGFLDPAANQDGPAFGLIAVLPDGTVIELPTVSADSPTARVQIIHNAADPNAEMVDVYITSAEANDTLFLDDVAFRSASAFEDVPAEVELELFVAPSNSSSAADAIATFTAMLEEGESYYIVANGVLNPDDFAPNPEEIDIAFTLLRQLGAREEAEDGESVDLTILHGATDAPAVGVNANGSVILDVLQYSEFAGPLSVPADEYQLDVTLGGQPMEIVASFDADISELGGGGAIIIASGFLDPAANQDGPAFGLIAVLPDGTVIELPVAVPTARVQIIHNAADPNAEVVDVYITSAEANDTLFLDDVTFRSASAFEDVPAEVELELFVAPSNSSSAADAIASFTTTLEDEESYYVVASGVLSPDEFAANPDEVATAFTLFIEPGAREAAEDGESVDLNVLHGATDAPNVGVNANGNVIIEGFSYSDFSGYLSVPADVYQLDVTLGGQPEEVVASFNADISGLGGGAALIIASGFLDPAANQDGPAFGLIAVLPDGTVIELPVPGMASIQMVHNVADPVAQIVDVYIDTGDETMKLDDLSYLSATPFMDLPADKELAITIADQNSENANQGVRTFMITLESGRNYFVVASGLLNTSVFADNPMGYNTELALYLDDEARRISAGSQFGVKSFHGVTDAPHIDILNNVTNESIVTDQRYGAFSSYNMIDADLANLTVTHASMPNQVLSTHTLDLNDEAGKSGLLLSTGFVDPTANHNGELFNMLMVMQDGSTEILSTATSGDGLIQRDEFLNVYPNPASGMATVSYEIERPGNVTFEILDVMGRNVHREIFTNQPIGQYKWDLSANRFNAGIHTVVMRSGQTRSVFKLMIVK